MHAIGNFQICNKLRCVMELSELCAGQGAGVARTPVIGELRCGLPVTDFMHTHGPFAAGKASAKNHLAARVGCGEIRNALRIQQRVSVRISPLMGQTGAVQVDRHIPVNTPDIPKLGRVGCRQVQPLRAVLATLANQCVDREDADHVSTSPGRPKPFICRAFFACSP